jgi:hypothetical protein
MTTTETRNPTADQGQKEYFDLHTSGIGYLSRIRTVTPKGSGRKSEPMLCCAINAMRGEVDDPQYTYFDLRVTEVEAQRLVLRSEDAVKAGKKVIVAFMIGDVYIHPYVKRVEGKDEHRAILKGRLFRISYIKVDGQVVYRRDDAAAGSEARNQGGSAVQGSGEAG